MTEKIYDLIILGAGPGGYVAAIRAAQLGLAVAVIESRSSLGGVCLNEGCIPSKALLDSSEYFALASHGFDSHGIEIPQPKINLDKMLARKDKVVNELTAGVEFLFKKNKITWIKGRGKLLGPNEEGVQQVEVDAAGISGRRVLLATGSKAVQFPDVAVDNKVVIDNVGALSLARVPRHLVVVGGGYIGLELGSIWLRLGAEVTVVEMLPQILPKADGEIAKALQRSLKKQGMKFHLNTEIESLKVANDGAKLNLLKASKSREVECDRVLMAIGRRPASDDSGIDALGIVSDSQHFIKVDENYQTSVPDIYAIGDLINGPMLAHKAFAEGMVFAERLAGQDSVLDYQTIAGVCYTHPEMAAVGRTEEQLSEEDIPYRVGRFNFMANGRARALGEEEGLVKILVHADNSQILGVHIFGARASEMIAEAVAVLGLQGTSEDVARLVHAHPTLSETLKEAALDVMGRAIHS